MLNNLDKYNGQNDKNFGELQLEQEHYDHRRYKEWITEKHSTSVEREQLVGELERVIERERDNLVCRTKG